MNKRIARTAAVLSLTAGVAFGASVPAMASHGGGGKENTGSCSQGSQWKLKAKSDDGQLEAEIEIDTNVSGQVWKWKVLDNGDVAMSGTNTTGGASGSFSVSRRIPNLPGTDKLVLKARTASTGETCKGVLKF